MGEREEEHILRLQDEVEEQKELTTYFYNLYVTLTAQSQIEAEKNRIKELLYIAAQMMGTDDCDWDEWDRVNKEVGILKMHDRRMKKGVGQ